MRNSVSVSAPKCISAEFMTIEELADDLRVSVRTVLRWRDRRTGPPPTIIGRRTFYRIEAVRQWALSREGVVRPGPAARHSKPTYPKYSPSAPAMARRRNPRREPARVQPRRISKAS